MQNINNCSAKDWPELGRERISSAEKPALNKTNSKRTNRKPNCDWEKYNCKQHWADILRREL